MTYFCPECFADAKPEHIIYACPCGWEGGASEMSIEEIGVITPEMVKFLDERIKGQARTEIMRRAPKPFAEQRLETLKAQREYAQAVRAADVLGDRLTAACAMPWWARLHFLITGNLLAASNCKLDQARIDRELDELETEEK